MRKEKAIALTSSMCRDTLFVYGGELSKVWRAFRAHLELENEEGEDFGLWDDFLEAGGYKCELEESGNRADYEVISEYVYDG